MFLVAVVINIQNVLLLQLTQYCSAVKYSLPLTAHSNSVISYKQLFNLLIKAFEIIILNNYVMYYTADPFKCTV